MLITLLVLKLTFEGILKECNRIAAEQDTISRNSHLKSRLARLEIDYHSGRISIDAYHRGQAEILQEIESISKQKSDNSGVNSSFEF